MDKFFLLLVCSDPNSKQRLKECIRVSTHRIEVQYLPKECDYPSILASHSQTDFILVGSPFHQGRITLTKEIKDALGEQCPPILALVGETDAGGSRLASLLGAGCDGIVLEPLSVNTVDTAITHIIGTGKFKKFREQRQRVVAQVVCASACGLIDKAAELALRRGRLETDDIREWRRLVVRLNEDWSTLGEELYAHILHEICSSRAPFKSRESGVRPRFKRKALHPARVVSKIMETRGITADKLATALKMDVGALQLFLDEIAQMNEELAENLARVLGQNKEYWLTLS